jgi:HEAT repeats/HEAT repeat
MSSAKWRMRRAGAVAAVVVVVAAGLVVGHFLSSREPVYQGKRLTEWLQQYTESKWAVPDTRFGREWVEAQHIKMAKKVEEAKTAIRRIGTNAVPVCWELMKTKEACRWEVELLDIMPGELLDFLCLPRAGLYVGLAGRRQLMGQDGFEALGEEAKSVVPWLAKFLKDKNEETRRNAALALGSMGPAAGEAVLELVRNLRDPDRDVRADVASALGDIHQMPEQSVPALIGILQAYSGNGTNDAPLAAMAAESLEFFGAQAKTAVPVLRELLNDPSLNVRSSASNALRRIGPAGAAVAARKEGKE